MNKRLILFVLLVLSFSSVYMGCSNKSVEPTISHLIVSDIPQNFSAPFGGPSPSPFFVTLTSSSEQVYNYTVSNNSDWLLLTNSKQTLSGFTPDSILFMIRVAAPTTLVQGTYYDTITIVTDSSAQDMYEKEIILTIGSEITAMPHLFEFEANLNGINPDMQELMISSSSSVPFDFTLSSTASWLVVPDNSYNTNDTDRIPVSVNSSSLAKGIHTDTIWVNSDSAFNSPFPVPVTVNVKAWLQQKSPRRNNLNDVYFADAQNGWAVGDVIDVLTKSGFLIKTTDGGKNWEEVLFLSATTSSDSILGGVTFVGSKGWAIGSKGIIMYSNNFGDDWTFQTPPNGLKTDFNDIFFVSADSGWIVGDSGVILATSDGGVTWVEQNSPVSQVLTGVTFVDNLHGWVSGLTDIIMVTSDGGQNWAIQSVPSSGGIAGNKYDFKEIYFADTLHGWAVGKLALIVSTIDGGTTWNYQQIAQIPSNTGLFSLFFINSTTGWIAGQNGEVLKTTDGGANWSNQFIESTVSLESIYFIDDNNGWAVGGAGSIFHTASGGE